jgi:voltage-gated potassium channel
MCPPGTQHREYNPRITKVRTTKFVFSLMRRLDQTLVGRKKDARRALRAQWRDAVVLFHESRSALILFVALVLGGAVLFYFFYTDPYTGQRINFSEALYGTFALLFFQGSLQYPHQGFIQILYFIIPILGLVVVADGVIRFGVALTNKQERGQKWQIAMASTYSGHVIICGMGKVGYRVALELMKFDRDIVAIEANPDGRFLEKTKALGIPVIIADARRSENLFKAGIEEADAVIPCTDNELTNLDIALDAREINPNAKIVMRMFDPELAQRVEKGFGIHTAFSVSALAAPTFAAASMRVNVRSSFYVGDQLLNISEIIVHPGATIEGWSIEKLEHSLDLSVVSFIEQGITHLHPEANLLLTAGSQLLVLATLETLQKLASLNKQILKEK